LRSPEDRGDGQFVDASYDAMSHAWIMRFLEHRIADKRILRLIAKWLKVGIIEDGRVTRGQVGAPQGAVISPTLANVYLHYAYDLWVQRWRGTKATGDLIVVRFADDRAPRRREEEVTM
jgi:RNA-directed DNA polymerase